MTTAAPAATMTDRDGTIAFIRTELKRRSGKTWSVTGGRGSSWGWITVTAPRARRITPVTNPAYRDGLTTPDEPRYFDGDLDKDGVISRHDRALLAGLLLLDVAQISTDGVSIPASDAHRLEYRQRAAGAEADEITVAAAYWD